MILFKKNAQLEEYVLRQKQNKGQIGFVPTMGALHQGHLSLVESSRKDNSKTVCSIFVNPTQFNDPNDFEKYPVTIEKDIQMLEAAGCDVLFLPPVTEVYPTGLQVKNHYELGYLETILEGKFRPGHFQGVCMVVHRLLEIVKPHNLYLGQKDYQQCMVIAKLTDLMGAKDSIGVKICPTLREPDGLAMSSRNMRLNKEEREKAPAIYEALLYIKQNLQKDNLSELKANSVANLKSKGFKVDYIEIANASSLQLINDPISNGWDGKTRLVALAAAFINDIRLIDNLLLNE